MSKISPVFSEPKKPASVEIAEDAELTPITKKKIPKVDASRWDDMTPSELYDQLFILEQRIMYCKQYGHMDAAKQIERGVVALRQLIEQRDKGLNLL
jgi:hypothetical protein